MTAHALDPRKDLSRYGHDRWEKDQGLPSSTILAIAQTRDGYLWLGTEDGLVRFDGRRFTVFDKTNTPELAATSTIQALQEDRAGHLWIGTLGGGLLRLDGSGFTRFTASASSSRNRIWAILEDGDGSLWLGTDDGLDRLKDGERMTYTKAEGLSSSAVRGLASDGKGRVFIGTYGGGVDVLENGRVAALAARGSPTGDLVRCLLFDRSGALWVGTNERGLRRFKDGLWTAYTARDGLSDDNVRAIHEDREGSLWIGTNKGLDRFRDGTFTAYRTRDGLASDVVLSILADRDGSLWVGTGGGGLDRLKDVRFTTLTTEDGLGSDRVWSILQDRAGVLWLGTYGAGLHRLENGRVGVYTTRTGLSNDYVLSLCEDREGRLWIGTNGGGLDRLEHGRITIYTTKDGLANDVVRSIVEDREGAIWIGTDGGLSRWKEGAFTTYTKRDGLSSDLARSLFVDRRGDLWIGAAGAGIVVRRRGTFTAYTTNQGMSSDQVRCFFEDGAGDLWIGTYGGGLDRLRNGAFTSYTTKQGLPDDAIFQILEDSRSNLWMSSRRGIFSVKKTDLDRLDHGELATLTPIVYDTADGLRTSEGAGVQPAGWRTSDGRLWFLTAKGPAVVDPGEPGGDSSPPPVLVEEVLVDERPVLSRPAGGTRSARLELPAGAEKLELHYTALDLRSPDKLAFRYKLEGFDRRWVDARSRRTAYYTHLPHGTYVFRVAARNRNGTWSTEDAEVRFRVLPFFYETPWFVALCAAAVGASGLALHRLRLRRLRERQRQLEALVDARTSELRRARDEVQESERELRRAQEQIEKLSRSSSALLESPAASSRAIAGEIARAIGAREIGVWRIEDGSLRALAGGDTPEPSWESLRAAQRTLDVAAAGAPTVVPILGVSGEPRGALVVDGPGVKWGEAEKRLVDSFAQHLGTMLDLLQMRERLTAAETRRAELRRDLHARGVATLQICPACGLCLDETPQLCPRDGARLDSTRLLPLVLQGRYRLEELLGEGGMGSVFRAADERLKREVAVKILKAESIHDPVVRLRLEREAEVVARIEHPNVVALYDRGELEDGSAFLVMELLRGRDLSQVLEQHGPGSPRQIARLLRQAGAALSAAHAAGIVHRDVKPQNLLLMPSDGGFQVKVVDFGVAKSGEVDVRLTMTGVLMGTPAYMTPEQVQGGAVDERTDVYALAAVGYEALTGRAVVTDSRSVFVLLDVLSSVPAPPSSLVPGLPPDVDAAFAAAFAKRPADRPPSVQDWLDSLLASLESAESPCPGWPGGFLS